MTRGSNLPLDLSDIERANATPVVAVVTPATAGVTHADSVWTLASDGSSGTFVLTINGVDTSALAYNANNAAVLAAVTAIAPHATVSGNAVSGTITDKTAELTIVVKTNSTDGTVTVTETSAFAEGLIAAVLPAGFYIDSIIISVGTAFNGTTPVMDVGTAADLECFAADVSLATADAVDATDSTLVTPVLKTAVTQKRYVKQDTNLIIGIAHGATAPTVGEATVIITPWAV